MPPTSCIDVALNGPSRPTTSIAPRYERLGSPLCFEGFTNAPTRRGTMVLTDLPPLDSASLGNAKGALAPADRLAAIVWKLVAAGLWCALVVGVLLAISSFIPANPLKAKINHWLPAWQAINFPLIRINQILLRTRYFGLGLSVIAVLGVLAQRWLRIYVSDVIESVAVTARRCRRFASAFVLRESVQCLLICLLTLHAAIIRWFFINQPMRCDESDTYAGTASRPIFEALSVYHSPNNHLLYTLLSHFTTLWFGGVPWAIRLPAFIAGILIVPVSYFAVRSLFNRHAAMIAAALASSSAYLILYSVNGRAYSLQCLFTCLALILCAYLVRSPNRFAWFLLSLVMAAGFYAIPTMLYPFSACFAWLFLTAIFSPPNLNRARFIADLFASAATAFLITAVLYLPVLLVAGPSKLFANRFVKPLPFSRIHP